MATHKILLPKIKRWFIYFKLFVNAFNYFSFNEAISLMVHCDTQEETDHYWTNLSAVPEAEQCGWLKDKFGFSWQIVPSVMGELLGSGDQEKTKRVTNAFLKMKKFDLAALKTAAESK